VVVGRGRSIPSVRPPERVHGQGGQGIGERQPHPRQGLASDHAGSDAVEVGERLRRQLPYTLRASSRNTFGKQENRWGDEDSSHGPHPS